MDTLKLKVKSLMDKGLFHILGTNVINSIISFFTNVLIVRLLSKEEFGIYGFANNQLGFFLLLSGLGLISGLLQFCSEKRKNDDKYKLFKFGFIIGTLINILLGIAILGYSIFAKVSIPVSKPYISLLMFIPLFRFTFEFISTVFRVNKENIKYARLLNINTISNFVFVCIGAYLGGISGTIVGTYLSLFISICLGIYMYKGYIVNIVKAPLAQDQLNRSLFRYSALNCFSSSLSSLLTLLDVYLIGIITVNAEIIGAYKVATSIPAALSFIPLAIMTFIYPYFTENNNDGSWMKAQTKKLLLILGAFNLIVTIILFIGAPLIISILYGSDYSDSILPFRILAINYFFSATFRIPCGNILAMMRKIKVNLIINLVCGVSNIILDIILIKLLGSVGAALATLGVVMISSIIGLIYLRKSLNSIIHLPR